MNFSKLIGSESIFLWTHANTAGGGTCNPSQREEVSLKCDQTINSIVDEESSHSRDCGVGVPAGLTPRSLATLVLSSLEDAAKVTVLRNEPRSR